MSRPLQRSRRPAPGARLAERQPHDVSPAEEAARDAAPGALSKGEKAKLAAEVSRIEDA